MKRALSLLLVLVTVLGMVSMTALAANPFTDVPSNQWYYNDVINAYENGLINGKTTTKYMPNDNLTYAEAVKLAAAMNQRYTTGAVTLQNGDPWYQTYVDYCKTKKIIDVDYSWNQPATRAGYMEIFASALPDSAMKEINKIPDGSIPDVPMSHNQAKAIYKLYRVGILQGNDEAHNCNPSANIKRSEVAAILTRMMDSSKRIQFSMDASALRITKNPENVTVKSGETATLSVEAAGGKTPYKYQWSMSRDGAREQWYDVSGKTDATISVKTDASAEGATMAYRCKVTDAAGATLYSDLGSITVSSSDLKIKTQPQGGNVKVSDTMKLSVSAEGGKAPYSYQWYVYVDRMFKDYLPLEGSEKAKNTTTAEMSYTFTAEDGAEKKFRCEITDANGKKVTSDAAVVTITAEEPLKIKNQPADQTIAVGETATLSVVAEGGKAPYTYQWKSYFKLDGRRGTFINLEGETASSLSVKPRSAGSGEYCCVVTDGNGNTVTSETATITATVAELKITTQPETVEVYSYDPAPKFAIAVTGGTAPYTFQWQLEVGDSWQNLVNNSDYGFQSFSNGNQAECQLLQDIYYETWLRCVVTDANGKQVKSNEFWILLK